MNESERSLLVVAEGQYGVVDRTQGLELGMSRAQIERLVGQRRLISLFPGVYRVAGSPMTERQRALAACRWLGAGAVVSHLSAAALLRLDGCRTGELHLTVPRVIRRRIAAASPVIHRVNSLLRVDRAVIDGIPCASATRTIIDCAGALDDEALEVAFESARRMGLTSPRALFLRVSELCGPGRPGSAAVNRLLRHQQAGDEPLHYRLEVKTARLLRRSALPRPQRQLPVGRYRIDFAFPDVRIGVEAEGFEYHGNRLAWKRDKRRTAWIEAQGWRLVFVTWDDVTQRPDETLDRIAIALGLLAA